MFSDAATSMAFTKKMVVVDLRVVVLWDLFDSWICEGSFDGWKDR